MQEPRDGDFVAYIDALQRESAARLAQQHVGVTQTTAASKTTGQFFEEKPKPVAASNLPQAVGRFVRRDTDGKVIKAIVAGVVGSMFLLTWLGDGGPFSLVAAVALLAYAVPRLVGAFRATAEPPPNKSAVEEVFGRKGVHKPGTGK